MRTSLIHAVAAVVCSATLSAAQPEEREHARARLISETKTLAPGTTAWLALDFEIDEHWHLYWNGVNDSGFAPKLNASFPAGFKAGEMLWPAPKRLVQPGDILDHVYENNVTLVFPVTVPADAKPGSSVEFKASPEWLVCHDVCLPGGADVRLKMTVSEVGQKPEPAPEASLFAKARERHPVPLPKAEQAARPVLVAAVEGKASIEVPGAKELTFYPGLEGVTFTKLIKEGHVKADRLVLSFERSDDHPARVRGVLEAKMEAGGTPKIWSLDVDLENKGSPGPSKPDPRARGD